MKEQRKDKTSHEDSIPKMVAAYLEKTGFRTLGDALSFYAGDAAPGRVKGMIEIPERDGRV